MDTSATTVHVSLGSVVPLLDQAMSRYQQGEYSQALPIILACLEQEPNRYDLWNFAGVLYRKLDDDGKAMDAYRRAIELSPDFSAAHNNLGNLYRVQERWADAIASYRHAIASNPNFAEGYSNMGGALSSAGDFTAAMEAFTTALAMRPDYADAHWDYALALLMVGRFAEGFREYEWRWKRREPPPRDFPEPQWMGQKIPSGQKLLIYTEQGFGDAIQYYRFFLAVLDKADEIIFEVLEPLFRLIPPHPKVKLVARGGPLPPFDQHCALLSLPHYLGITEETLPRQVPYLKVPESCVEQWRKRIGVGKKFRVGLIWSGNPNVKNDHIRSPRLKPLLPLFELSGVEFFILQKGGGRKDLEGLTLPPHVVDIAQEVGDFADTAALMQLMDLVLSSDTSTAHLAGALGLPLWIMLPHVPDWRWMLHREDSIWYPTARLFRQPEPGAWHEVVRKVKEALIQKIAEYRIPADAVTSTPVQLQQALQAWQKGEYARAVQLCEDAVTVAGTLPEAWILRGIVQRTVGNLEEALNSYRQALTHAPHHADVWHNLGNLYRQQGEIRQAMVAYQSALLFRPAWGEVHALMSDLHRQLGDMVQAEISARRAVEMVPHYAEGWNALGNALNGQRQDAEALDAYFQAQVLDPSNHAPFFNAATLLERMQRWEGAIVQYKAVLGIQKDHETAHLRLGLCCRQAGWQKQAKGVFENMLRIFPGHAEAIRNLAEVCNSLGALEMENLQFSTMIPLFRQAITLAPHFAEAHFNLALILLQLGDYPQGFGEYEWRRQLTQIPPRTFSRPFWNGESLIGKRILIYAEQGFGDTLQFFRFVPMVVAQAAGVYLEVQPALKRFCQSVPGIQGVVSIGDAYPPVDLQCSMLSLPHCLRVTLANLPRTTPYLAVPEEIRRSWRQQLGETTKRRVGLVWAGSPTNAVEKIRSPKFLPLLPLLSTPGVHFYLLQKGGGLNQLEGVALPDNVTVLGTDLNDFADTAAVISNLDLMISSDTSVAHLSGALGAPLWVMLHYSADWRWLEEEGSSCWYPHARLFRQKRPGDWASLVERVRQALMIWVEAPLGEGDGPERLLLAATQLESAISRYHAGDHKTSEEHALIAIGANPRLANGWILLGVLARARGALERAVLCYRQALAINANQAEAWYNLGNCCKAMGHWEDAQEAFSRTCLLRPDWEDAYNQLSDLLRIRGVYPGAAAMARHILNGNPNKASLWNNLGNVYQAEGKSKDALACYQQGLSCDPELIELHYNEGVAYQKLLDFQQAELCYRRVLAKKPDHSGARQNLEAILQRK